MFRLSTWLNKFCLHNEDYLQPDVELLALEIMDSTKGELIEQKLEQLTQTVGSPIQIVADHGSDHSEWN